MQIPKTWENIPQPDDDKTVGDVWFYVDTYREYHEGLKLALERLKTFSDVAKELELTSSPYDKEVGRLTRIVEWGEERLKDPEHRGDVTIGGASYKTLRYLKAGGLLRAQRLIQRRQEILLQRRLVPKAILQAFDQRIEQLLNLAEVGSLKGLRPAELFFELVMAEPTELSVEPATVRSVITNIVYAPDSGILDPVLRERCQSIINSFDEKGLAVQFDTVIREMSVVLEDRVRQLSGCSEKLSGADLFAAAMAGDNPKIKFSDRKDLQESAHLLFRGYSGFVRNEVMHKLIPSFTRERVYQLLGMVDYLLDLLATAQIATKSSGKN